MYKSDNSNTVTIGLIYNRHCFKEGGETEEFVFQEDYHKVKLSDQ